MRSDKRLESGRSFANTNPDSVVVNRLLRWFNSPKDRTLKTYLGVPSKGDLEKKIAH